MTVIKFGSVMLFIKQNKRPITWETQCFRPVFKEINLFLSAELVDDVEAEVVNDVIRWKW